MATGPQKDIVESVYPDKAVVFTDVDLNATGTTDIYNPSADAIVHGAFLAHGGSTAVVELAVTDGTDTAVLTPGQAAGDGIAFGDTVALSSTEKLQANVTTAEGSALTETAGVSRGE